MSPPMIVETPRIARLIAPVTIRPTPRPPPTSIFIRRPDRNEPNRFGASRKSSAFRDGGVSTTIRSQRFSESSLPSFSIAMYSCVPENDDAIV